MPIVFINSKASGVLYISGVGGGKIPVAPKIGVKRIKQRMIFKIMFMVFMGFSMT